MLTEINSNELSMTLAKAIIGDIKDVTTLSNNHDDDITVDQSDLMDQTEKVSCDSQTESNSEMKQRPRNYSDVQVNSAAGWGLVDVDGTDDGGYDVIAIANDLDQEESSHSHPVNIQANSAVDLNNDLNTNTASFTGLIL